MSFENSKRILSRIFLINLLVTAAALAAMSQTSAFTYQGSLLDNGLPANGTYNMTFKVFDALAAGGQQGSTITNTTVNVANGIFTVQLDFTTSPFVAGADRWLEIAVKKPADPTYTTLSPRQQITSNPYTIRTINAGSADGLSAACTGCVDGTKIANGAVTDANVSPTAAIAYSKLNLTNSIQNADITANAITTSKIANGTVTTSKMADQAVDSLKILDGAIVDADISPTAAVAYSKLNLTNSIQNADITANAITTSKIASGTVTTSKIADQAVDSLKILDGAITNADISASAAIATSKISGLGTLATQSPTGTANATTFLRGDNTWAAAGGASTIQFAARATNLILNSGTYVDIISIPLEANKTYFLETLILGQRVGAVSGPGTFQLVYSGSATTDFGLLINANYLPDTTIDSTPSFDLEANAATSNFSTTQSQKYDVSGYIRTTSAGTLTIRGARASTNTTIDLNVREGSFILARPIN